MAIHIAFYKGEEKLAVVELNKKIYLGRNKENDVAIDDQSISGTHCLIEIDPNNFVQVYDLNSKNGIHFGGKRVGSHSLLVDQRLYVGQHHIMIEKSLLTKAEAFHLRNEK